jgi:preprotein translocase subunit YajC
LPYILLFNYFAVYKGAKLLFAILSIEVFGNVAIINGLLSSYLISGQNNPTVDTIARILTFILFIPIIYRFIRPQYLKMAKTLNNGWWILNFVLIISYALAYYILFVPDSIFSRPNFFVHGYIGIILSLLIYAVIFFLFVEIQNKVDTERDKQLLAIQVGSLAAQSKAISTSEEKINILRHDMRHHLAIIKEQISIGDFAQASKMLDNFESQLTETHVEVYCKNKIINAALTYYLSHAIQNNIKIESKLDIPDIIHVNPAELAIVFANAIENSINACLKIQDISKRKISLVSHYQKGNLVLEISNPNYEKVKFNEKGIPIALAKDHGTGVMSFFAFANKNDAILEFSQENDIFYLRLLINSI